MSYVTDFKYVRDYPVDVENFGSNITEMVDSVYVGPQGDLLEKLSDFNTSYNTNLGLTKNFTFKPGCYDAIKKVYSNYCLRWDMRPRGVKSLFDRMHDYRWRTQGFKTSITNIEKDMLHLRRSGIVWQDNADQLIIELTKLKSIINNALKVVAKLYPNIEVKVKLAPCNKSTAVIRHTNWSPYSCRFPEIQAPDYNETNDYIIIFYVHVKDMNMVIHELKPSGNIEQYNIPMEDTIIVSGTYLLPLLSRNWQRDVQRTDMDNLGQTKYFLEGLYLAPMEIDRHPYINTSYDAYAWNMLEEFSNPGSNICTGSMGTEIRATLLNLQIEAHLTYLVTWITNYYIPQTNPLNNIKKLKRFGKPVSFEETLSPALRKSIGWKDCTLPESISQAIYHYAKGRRNYRHAYNDSHRYSLGSEEYLKRTEDYINSVKRSDLPCANCVYRPECETGIDINMLFSREIFTPMEEAYLGMYLEIYASARVMHDRRKIYFLEEAIHKLSNFSVAYLYDKIVRVNTCCTRWSQSQNEEILAINWDDSLFKDRYRTMYAIKDTILETLYNEAINPESQFKWTLTNVAYAKPTISEEAIKRVVKNLTSSEDDILDVARDALDEQVGMTTEERTLQWATSQGGAHNL